MIYDCFTFFNELDLLEIRLNTLDGVVDKFVIAEATRTHTGKPKPLYYRENQARFAAFRDKIIHIVVDDLLSEDEVAKDTFNLPWVNENRQRNALAKGLAAAKDDDVFMVSDLDEIPRPEKIAEAVKLAQKGEIVRFVEDVYSYYVNFKNFQCPHWQLGTQMVSWRTFCGDSRFDRMKYDRFTVKSECSGHVVHKVRFIKSTKFIRNGGWHMGYLGGVAAIRAKLGAFAHAEARKVIDSVEDRLMAGENIFGGKRDNFAVPIDDSFPICLRDKPERFSHLVFPCDDEYLNKTRLFRKIAYLRGAAYRFCVSLVPPFMVGPLAKLRILLHFR